MQPQNRQGAAPGAAIAFRRLFEEALTRRDTAALLAAVTPELVIHSRGRSATIRREALWDLSAPILTGFPDIVFHVDDVVAAGDKAAARVSFSATHRAPWGGIAPTGRRVAVTEMFLCRLAAGKIAECWQEWDEYGLRQQLTLRR